MKHRFTGKIAQDDPLYFRRQTIAVTSQVLLQTVETQSQITCLGHKSDVCTNERGRNTCGQERYAPLKAFHFIVLSCCRWSGGPPVTSFQSRVIAIYLILYLRPNNERSTATSEGFNTVDDISAVSALRWKNAHNRNLWFRHEPDVFLEGPQQANETDGCEAHRCLYKYPGRAIFCGFAFRYLLIRRCPRHIQL